VATKTPSSTCAGHLMNSEPGVRQGSGLDTEIMDYASRSFPHPHGDWDAVRVTEVWLGIEQKVTPAAAEPATEWLARGPAKRSHSIHGCRCTRADAPAHRRARSNRPC